LSSIYIKYESIQVPVTKILKQDDSVIIAEIEFPNYGELSNFHFWIGQNIRSKPFYIDQLNNTSKEIHISLMCWAKKDNIFIANISLLFDGHWHKSDFGSPYRQIAYINPSNLTEISEENKEGFQIENNLILEALEVNNIDSYEFK
jgi:hypothetical protein